MSMRVPVWVECHVPIRALRLLGLEIKAQREPVYAHGCV